MGIFFTGRRGDSTDMDRNFSDINILADRICANFSGSVLLFRRPTWDDLPGLEVYPTALPGAELHIMVQNNQILLDTLEGLTRTNSVDDAWEQVKKLGKQGLHGNRLTAWERCGVHAEISIAGETECSGWGARVIDASVPEPLQGLASMIASRFDRPLTILSRLEYGSNSVFLEIFDDNSKSLKLRLRHRNGSVQIEADWIIGDDGDLIELSYLEACDWVLRAGTRGLVHVSQERFLGQRVHCFIAGDPEIDCLLTSTKSEITSVSLPWL